MKPSELKLASPDPYIFKSRLKRRLMAAFDGVGYTFFNSAQPSVDPRKLKKVAVLRLDHLGDVLLALPFVEALRRALPKAQIDFYVGPWAEAGVDLSGLRVDKVIFKAPWFDRTGLSAKGSGVQALTRRLQQGNYDVAFDLRGDLRHIRAMKKAGIPVRVGQPLTGGAFWLTHCGRYANGLSEGEQNGRLLALVGLKVKTKRYQVLSGGPLGAKEATAVLRKIKKPFVVLHATCAATSKRWPEENWKELIEGFPKGLDLVLVGAKSERRDMESIAHGLSRKVWVTGGDLSLFGLAAFLQKAKLFIGVDSGPAHIAAGVGVPVLSLFSGTNLASQWASQGNKVVVLQQKTECSPCGLTQCPLAGHPCMKKIEVEAVLGHARRLLK